MSKMTVSLETEERGLGQLLKQVLLVKGVLLKGIGISQEPVLKEPKVNGKKGGARISKRPEIEALLQGAQGSVTVKEMQKILHNPFVHLDALIKEKKVKKIGPGAYKWIGEKS